MCPKAWVVNAYLLTFGGFLLLGGRLGDLFGHRRLFVIGLSLFTTASLACGLAQSQGFLVGARAVQGLGGAIVAVVALSLIMTLFTEPAERAKAMGVIGFVAAGGGSVGVLLGGVLTDVLDWHWIFLVNIPVGAIVLTLCLRLVPGGRGAAADGRLDVAGAVTVTAALMLAVYAIVNGNDRGWASAQTLGMLAVANRHERDREAGIGGRRGGGVVLAPAIEGDLPARPVEGAELRDLRQRPEGLHQRPEPCADGTQQALLHEAGEEVQDLGDVGGPGDDRRVVGRRALPQAGGGREHRRARPSRAARPPRERGCSPVLPSAAAVRRDPAASAAAARTFRTPSDKRTELHCAAGYSVVTDSGWGRKRRLESGEGLVGRSD